MSENNAASRLEGRPAETIGAAIPLLVTQIILFLFFIYGPDAFTSMGKDNPFLGLIQLTNLLLITGLLYMAVATASMVACMLALTALLLEQRLADRLLRASGGLFGVSLLVFVGHLFGVLGLLGDHPLEERLLAIVVLVVFALVTGRMVFIGYRRAGRAERRSIEAVKTNAATAAVEADTGE